MPFHTADSDVYDLLVRIHDAYVFEHAAAAAAHGNKKKHANAIQSWFWDELINPDET